MSFDLSEISGLPEVKPRHLDIIEKHGGKHAGKALAVIAAAQVATPIVKSVITWTKKHENYTIAIEGSDDIYPDLHEWVLARIPENERKAMIASTGEGMGRPTYKLESPGNVEAPPVYLRYDGSRSQEVIINDHKITVDVERQDASAQGTHVPDSWKRVLERIIFSTASPEGRDAVIEMIEDLQKIKYEKQGPPPLLIPSRWGGSWNTCKEVPPRTLDSVILKEGQTERLVKDLETFLASEDVYNRVSQPWHRGYLFHGIPGTGKAQPLDVGVLTPTGYVEMGDLQEHDYVIGANGLPTEVTGIYDQGELPIYRIEMSDGTSTEACADHLWQVQTHGNRVKDKPGSVRTTQEIIDDLYDGRERSFYIPQVVPVKFNDHHGSEPLPIDPYLLGLLLGDGCFRNTVELCSADPELLNEAERLAGSDTTCTRWPDRGGSAAITMGFRKRTSTGNPGGQGRSPLAQALSELGLFGLLSTDKFIPDMYKRASIQDRHALLAGLMDTDGGAERTAAVFYSSSLRLTTDMAELVELLGGTAYVSDRIPLYGKHPDRLSGKRAYRVSLRLPIGWCPFRLERKVKQWESRPHNPPVRSIVNIDPSRMAEARCITVESPDNLYVTEHGIVTHNTSIVKALANHFGMPLYYLPLGDVDKDADLMGLVTDINPRSILLLEDVDVFHAMTKRDDEKAGTTIASMLNALDGVWTPHGLITVMTTNNRDQLDDALIRAGRVDVDEEFTALDQDQAARLSKWMWPEQESDLFSQNFVGKSPAKLIKKIRKRQQKEEI